MIESISIFVVQREVAQCSREMRHITNPTLHSVTATDSSSSMVPRPSLHSAISLDDTTSLDSRGSEGGVSRGSDKGSEGGVGETSMGEEDAVEDVDSVFQLIPSDGQ